MNSILQLIGFLFSGLGAGINRIRIMAPAVARPYLRTLEKSTYIAVGMVTFFVILSFVTYWVSLLGHISWLSWFGLLEPLWRIFMLAAGLFALLFGFLMGILVTPIGTLVNVATTAGTGTTASGATTLPWYRWFSPIGLIRETRRFSDGLLKSLRNAINQYMEAVRFVLVVSGGGFFFFAFMPKPSVTLAFASVVGLTFIWLNRAYKTIWSWLAQVGVLTVLGFLVLILRFPKVKWFSLFVPSSTPEDLTEVQIRAGAKGLKGWILTWGIFEYVVFALVLVGGIFLIRWLKRTIPADETAVTGADHHPKTTKAEDPHHPKKNYVGSLIGIGAAVAIVALLGTGIQGCHQEHIAEFNERMARLRLLDEQAATEREKRLAHPHPAPVQTATPTPASNGNGGAVWKGLKNPNKQVFQYSTNWGPVIQKPDNAWVASDPPGLRPEIMINGDTNNILRPDGLTEWPSETRFFRVRNPRDETQIYVTFGVGPKAVRP